MQKNQKSDSVVDPTVAFLAKRIYVIRHGGSCRNNDINSKKLFHQWDEGVKMLGDNPPWSVEPENCSCKDGVACFSCEYNHCIVAAREVILEMSGY